MRRMKRLQIMCRCLTSRTSHRVCPCASRRQSKRAVNIEPAVTGFSLSIRPYFGDLVAILVGAMLVSMQVHLRQQLHPGLRIQTHFIPVQWRIGWYVMCNQVVLISTAEKSLRCDTQRFALPMEGFECCVVVPKILRRRGHCREPSTNKHVHHAMRPAALFFNGAVGNALNPRIRKLFLPPTSNINISTEVWPPKADRHLIFARHFPDVATNSKQ